VENNLEASVNSAARADETGYSNEVAQEIADTCADAGISLVASLPDDWIAYTISKFEQDDRFNHVPVNREESALGLCSGAFLAGTGSAALMGASGLMTLVYGITKINYTYEIPIFFMITHRGTFDDGAKFHVSNGLYLEDVMKSINLPYTIINSRDELPMIGEAYHHSRKISRPSVAVLPKKLLLGKV
jgi:sulfopyruvate decarboxylase subunit alpha